MTSDNKRYDAIAIGGGFAGAVAARDLTEQGKRVLLLEARDRLGGRTYSSKFPGTDVDVEVGGQFIVPAFYPHIMAEIERYGFSSGDLPEPEVIETILNNTRHAGMFPPLEQMFDIDRRHFRQRLTTKSCFRKRRADLSALCKRRRPLGCSGAIVVIPN